MRRNWLEWAILVVSVASILALVGYLGFKTFAGGGPAAITITASPDRARATPAGWELPVTVRNGGGAPAASVTIEATATVAGSEETAELAVDLLAPGSEADLVVAFSAAPDGEVTFRLIGYESP